MSRKTVEELCAEQGATLSVSTLEGRLSATVSLPEGKMWDWGHTSIGFTQREDQDEPDFWAELSLGMMYQVVSETA